MVLSLTPIPGEVLFYGAFADTSSRGYSLKNHLTFLQNERNSKFPLDKQSPVCYSIKRIFKQVQRYRQDFS